MKALCFMLLMLAMTATAQDYLIKPEPASLTADASTTLLLDLSAQTNQAAYAAGSSTLTLDTNLFIAGGGYKGVLSFAGASNFPTNAWTLEMIVRVSCGATNVGDMQLLYQDSAPAELEFILSLDQEDGPKMKLYCYDGADSFVAQPYSGGSGASIQNSAPDKWVYVSFGIDYTGQQALVIARELTGDLLNRDIEFAPTAYLDTDLMDWSNIRTRFAQGRPATFSFGNTNVEIRSLRISQVYRTNIFTITPVLPIASATTFTPSSIDPTRLHTQSVSRSVGYYALYYVNQTISETNLWLAPGSAAMSITLTNLPVGLYTCFVYGSVTNSIARVWRPCPMDFQATNSGGQLLASGRMLLKQGSVPRRMQGFQFHQDIQATNVTLNFSLTTNALETAWIQKLVLVDQLAGFPDVAIKTAQNLADGATNQLSSLTQDRQDRDDLIWNSLPPLNTHLQVNAQVPEFSSPPAGATTDTWLTKSLLGLELYLEPNYTFSPLDFTNTTSGGMFYQSNILTTTAWPGTNGEDPTGVFYSTNAYPALTNHIYNTKRAELLGKRYLLFAGALMDSRGSLYGLQLPLAYFTDGNAEIGHDAAIALVRWAYDWPALDMTLHEIRLSTHSPDFEYGTDMTDNPIRYGKMLYLGFSGDHARWLLEAYDQVFPYIKDNQVFADAVHRFIPWVNTPQDVVRMLDRYLVWSSVRDVGLGLIDAASGVTDSAAVVLGPDDLTVNLFDLTQQYSEVYPIAGTYQEMYATALSRSGSYYIASFLTYAFGDAQGTITKAYRMKQAREAGVTIPMDLSDVDQYPKVRSAGNFLLDMWVAGGFPFMVGDASGGTHSGLEATNRLVAAGAVVGQAFDLMEDSRHAWVMKNLLGNTNAAVLSAASGVTNPITHNTSRVVPDYGAILELSPWATNALEKTSATLRLGIGIGHAHSDYLDLNLFGMGLPLAVDLAVRNEGDNWSRPGANWSFLHNHALAHPSSDPSGAGDQTGEPWLRAFAPPIMRASYVDTTDAVRLDRDVVLMEVGDTDTYYAFDVQRLQGNTNHTWAFHGCESDALVLNVEMTTNNAATNRWVDRLLETTQKVGLSSNFLQATWTMTRSTNGFSYAFSGGGVIETVAAEQAVLGSRYNSNLAPVNVRATLLTRTNDVVFQGNPYSDAYSYSFPFIWVQRTNAYASESVYPALYEWYRGSTPVITNAVVLALEPLQVRVSTATGQIDDYESTTNYCLAVSRDATGLRWAKLSGYASVSVSNLVLTPGTNYDVTITGIDYAARTLTTSGILPNNCGVTAGNSGRQIFLQLTGYGTNFTWADDLLVQEGQLASACVVDSNTITMSSSQAVLFDGNGNRSTAAMTVTTEDGLWHFRGGEVIESPADVTLTTGVFTDANEDGYINVKTYEIGIGDHLTLPVDITLDRSTTGWRVQSNVSVNAVAGSLAFSLPASEGWQSVLNPPRVTAEAVNAGTTYLAQ